MENTVGGELRDRAEVVRASYVPLNDLEPPARLGSFQVFTPAQTEVVDDKDGGA
jgi:hypothetical protein